MEKKDDHKTTEEKETAEELLRKIQKLEADHAHLNHHISNLLLLLINNNNNFNFNFNNNNSNHNHNQSDRGRPSARGKSIREHTAVNGSLSGTKWQKIFMVGCTAAEALGKTAPDIIIEPRYSELATVIIQRAVRGETWSGQFPVRTKYGEKFSVITTLSPCRDENGTTFGVTCVCADARPFRESWPQSSLSVPHRISSGHDPHQPPQAAIVSKISNLASILLGSPLLILLRGVKTNPAFKKFYLKKQRPGCVKREFHGHGKEMQIEIVLI